MQAKNARPDPLPLGDGRTLEPGAWADVNSNDPRHERLLVSGALVAAPRRRRTRRQAEPEPQAQPEAEPEPESQEE